VILRCADGTAKDKGGIMANVKFYNEEIEEGTVSIGYGVFPVKGHVLEIPEETAAGWDPGPLWKPYQPRKHSKRQEVTSDDSKTE